MGYQLDGNITITPSLNYVEIAQARTIALGMIRQGWDRKGATEDNVFDNYMPLTIQLDQFDKTTEEGILKVTRGISLVPSYRDGARLSYDICELVTKLAKGIPGHNWEGVITALHEEGHEATKFLVTTDGDARVTAKAVHGKAYIRWEDGSDETPVSDLI